MHYYISNEYRGNRIFNILSGLLVLWWLFRTFPCVNGEAHLKEPMLGLCIMCVHLPLDILKENCLLYIKSNYLCRREDLWVLILWCRYLCSKIAWLQSIPIFCHLGLSAIVWDVKCYFSIACHYVCHWNDILGNILRWYFPFLIHRIIVGFMNLVSFSSPLPLHPTSWHVKCIEA